MRFGLRAMLVTCLLLMAFPMFASTTAYFNDLSGFNTAAGSPPVSLDFDSIAAGTDISGTTINGVTFTQLGSPLIVVKGSDTFTPGPDFGLSNPNPYSLHPTSGDNVLSPGGTKLGAGPDPATQLDSMELTFSSPVSAFGFDLIYQSNDGASFVGIQVFDSNNNSVYNNGFIPSSGAGPGLSDFWGFVVDPGDAGISKIVISEFDENNANPDSNIGFDTFRYGAATGVPEPSSLMMLGSGLLAAIGGLRRARRS